MKKRLFFVGCFLLTGYMQLSNAQEKKPEVRPFQFGIVYPIGTNGIQSAKIANVFSINWFMGMSAGVEAAEFSGFMSITNGDVNGIQGSGFVNINRGNIRGVHGAGFANFSKDVNGVQGSGFFNMAQNVEGVQGSGFCNISKDFNGVQGSGFCNVAKNVDGIQATGFVNISDNCKGAQLSGFVGVADNVKHVQMAGFVCVADSVEGIQGSGFMNFADKTKGAQLTGFLNLNGDVDGIQGAGFMNIAKDVKGAQASGFLNVANDVTGAQVSGFMNIAGKVHGPQISGFLNVADSSEYPIGVINWVKNGTKQLVVETDENTAVNVLFKSGGRRTYGIFGMSYQPVMPKTQWGITCGIGAHFPLSGSLTIDADLSSTFYYDYSFKKDNDNYFNLSQFRVMANYKINDRISIFAGPKLYYTESETHETDDLRGIELWSGTHNNRHHSYHLNYGRLLVGATAGIEISLK